MNDRTKDMIGSICNLVVSHYNSYFLKQTRAHILVIYHRLWIEMAISTNPYPTIYRKLYENAAQLNKYLLNHFDQIFNDSFASFIGNDSCGQVSQYMRT